MSDSPQVPGLQVSHATLADQLPLSRKLLLEPCGPQGLPFSPPFGITDAVPDATPEP